MTVAAFFDIRHVDKILKRQRTLRRVYRILSVLSEEIKAGDKILVVKGTA